MVDTRESVLVAARSLFAERGFDGASVRDICERAGSSANAVTYHFGSKEQLYKDVLGGLASAQLELAGRVLSSVPRSHQEFAVRLELYFSQLLDAYLEDRETFRLIALEFEQQLPHSDRVDVIDRLIETNRMLADFIARAQDRGFVAPDIDPAVVSGMLLDRVLNQARFADSLQRYFEASTLDPEYRQEWVHSTLRVVLDGISAREEPQRRERSGQPVMGPTPA